MQLFELTQRVPWEQVKAKLLKFYPDEKEHLDNYQQTFQQLKEMKATACSKLLYVGFQKNVLLSEEDEEEDDFVQVWGQEPGEDISYALEFQPWSEWLGMKLAKQSVRDYSDAEILAHCLWEMTFFGFSETEIQSELETLIKQKEDWDKLTEEEKKQQSISWEDLKKEFGLGDS